MTDITYARGYNLSGEGARIKNGMMDITWARDLSERVMVYNKVVRMNVLYRGYTVKLFMVFFGISLKSGGHNKYGEVKGSSNKGYVIL